MAAAISGLQGKAEWRAVSRLSMSKLMPVPLFLSLARDKLPKSALQVLTELLGEAFLLSF